MLDELLEYRTYSRVLDQSKSTGCSLKSNQILEDRVLRDNSGLSRILETLVRGQYFGIETDNFEQEKDPIQLEKFLCKWLDAFSELIKQDDYKNRIKNIIDTAATQYAWKKGERGKLGKRNILRCDIYDQNSVNTVKLCKVISDSSTNINQILFTTVIADALESGPLKKYYLLCKEDFFQKQNPLVQAEDTSSKLKKRRISKVRCGGSKDYLLKLTAMYLQNRIDESKTTCIKKADLMNWWSVSGDIPSKLFYCVRESNEQFLIFKEIPIPNIKLVKFEFDPKWINNYKLIDVTNAKSEEELLKKEIDNGYKYYYKDLGLSEELELFTIKIQEEASNGN